MTDDSYGAIHPLIRKEKPRTTVKYISLTVFATAILALFAGNAEAALLNLTGAPVTASSEFGGTGACCIRQYAFDDSLATRWASANFGGGDTLPQWIYVDLGMTYVIDRVDLDWQDAHGADYRIAVFDGAVPPDPESAIGSWNTIATISGRSGIAGSGAGPSGGPDEIFDFNAATWTPLFGGGTPGPLTTGATGNFLLVWSSVVSSDLSSLWEIDVFASEPVVIPEASALPLAALGLLSLGLFGWRRRRKCGMRSAECGMTKQLPTANSELRTPNSNL